MTLVTALRRILAGRAPRAFFLLVGVCLVTLLLGSAPVLAQETGAVEGVVTNGTAGAAPPADAEVVIHVLQSRVKTGEQRVRTDAAGRFQARGLASGPDTLYFPIVQYGGVAYYPDRPLAPDASAPVRSEITVFEATPNAEAVSFERLNMLVMGVTPSALTIMEMGAAVNASDRAFVADPETTGSARTLRFLLPPGAIEITPQAGLPGDTLESTPNGFATTDPVRPGRREIAFSYQLPYTSSTLDLTRAFTLPVSTFTLYLPAEYGAVVPNGVALPGLADLGGRQYRQYAVENVAPDTEVRIRLTGLPAPLFARPRDLGLLVAGLVAAVLTVCLLYAIRRRRTGLSAPADAPDAVSDALPPTLTPDAERQALIRAIAQLDARYDAGELDEAAYHTERSTRKARLLGLARVTAEAR